MMRAFFCLIVVLASLEIPGLNAQVNDKSVECTSKAEWLRQVHVPGDDWGTDFADKAHPIGPEAPVLTSASGYSDVVEIQLAVRKRRFEFPEVLVDRCNNTVSIKKSYLDVTEVRAYKKHGRTFAYKLTGETVVLNHGEWMPCMCSFSVTVYDSSGVGKFDFLRVAMGGPPIIPEWAK